MFFLLLLLISSKKRGGVVFWIHPGLGERRHAHSAPSKCQRVRGEPAGTSLDAFDFELAVCIRYILSLGRMRNQEKELTAQ